MAMVVADEQEFWARLSARETVPFRALGNSMLPFYPSGTLFLLQHKPVEQLQKGDIILIHPAEGDRLVLHRFLKREGEQLCTKGDWNIAPDMLWPLDAYAAKAVALVAEAGPRPLLQLRGKPWLDRNLGRLSIPMGKCLAYLRYSSWSPLNVPWLGDASRSAVRALLCRLRSGAAGSQ